MNIPPWLATILVTAIFALQGWTLNEIVNLKVAIGSLNARLENQIHITTNP